MAGNTVELFTKEEHVILADWLGIDVQTEQKGLPTVSDALIKLDFVDRASAYSENDAAVASIVLERIQESLPQWGQVRTECDGEGYSRVTLARDINDRRAARLIELVPQYLMTINWADSGPGFSWPVAYYVTWVPLYDCFVVTQSADSPDAFGYCDIAIGHFPNTKNFVDEATKIIEKDWKWQFENFEQSRWAYLFGAGLIDEDRAVEMRETVWDDELEEDL